MCLLRRSISPGGSSPKTRWASPRSGAITREDRERQTESGKGGEAEAEAGKARESRQASQARQQQEEARQKEVVLPNLRFNRDRRGYETTALVEAGGRRRKGQRILYFFRTPPAIRVGREALDPEAMRLLEQHNPDVAFDWPRLIKAGANVIVSGSGVFGTKDYAATIAELRKRGEAAQR